MNVPTPIAKKINENNILLLIDSERHLRRARTAGH
jgi:hypothetical protein